MALIKQLSVNLVFSKDEGNNIMCELYRKSGDYVSFLGLYVCLKAYFDEKWGKNTPINKESKFKNIVD